MNRRSPIAYWEAYVMIEIKMDEKETFKIDCLVIDSMYRKRRQSFI